MIIYIYIYISTYIHTQPRCEKAEPFSYRRLVCFHVLLDNHLKDFASKQMTECFPDAEGEKVTGSVRLCKVRPAFKH